MVSLNEQYQLVRKRNRTHYSSPQYKSWVFVTVSSQSAALQPYRLKQYIPRWKARIKARHFPKAFRRTKQLDDWGDIIPRSHTLETISVNVINTVLKSVKLSR